MTERYVINDNMIEDTLSDDYYHFNDWQDFEGLCKLANDLHNENQPLKYEIKRISKEFKEALNEVINKNQELRLTIEELKPFKEKPSTIDPVIPLLHKEIDRLTEENEQLKKELKKVLHK